MSPPVSVSSTVRTCKCGAHPSVSGTLVLLVLPVASPPSHKDGNTHPLGLDNRPLKLALGPRTYRYPMSWRFTVMADNFTENLAPFALGRGA